jgi:putative DNA primase/helicase
MTALHYRDLAGLAAGRYGAIDVICPVCSQTRRRINQRKKVMRLWVKDDDFISFKCAHCGAAGCAADKGASRLSASDVARRRAEAAKQQAEDSDRRAAWARRIWDSAVDPRGTLAEIYLREHRKLELTDDLAGAVLRFHPSIRWEADEAGITTYVPALIGAFRGFDDDSIVAVHRIALNPDGSKIGRKMLGPVGNAAVKLAPVSDTLAVAEGVETAIAANMLGYGPAWALGSAGAVASLPVLLGIERLILLEENNAPSREAVDRCGRRWLRAGRQVRRVRPDNEFDDLNDELISKKGV